MCHGVDLLLDGLESELPLRTLEGVDAAVVPPISLSSVSQQSISEAESVIKHPAPTQAALDLVRDHVSQLRQLSSGSAGIGEPFGKASVAAWARPLRQVSQLFVTSVCCPDFPLIAQLIRSSISTSPPQLIIASPRLAHTLFVEIFSRLWTQFRPEEHARLQQHMLTLLARDRLRRQSISASAEAPNIAQTLIEAVAACSPPMFIPAPLLRYSAKTFNCWHSVTRLLEDRLLFEPADDEALDAITDLYSQLSEHDIISGIWLHRSVCVVRKSSLKIFASPLFSYLGSPPFVLFLLCICTGTR